MRAGGTKPSQEVPFQHLQPLRGDVGASAATLDWPTLQTAVTGCQACKLCEGRTHAVFGTGQAALAPATVPQVDWLLVGEAPVEDEDRQGQAFVAQPGQLLDNMLAALGLQRNAGVFVTHALKCRPPSNRSPEPDELAQCLPYLQRQVDLLRPKVVLALGRLAAQALLQSTDPLGRLRGQVHRPAGFGGAPVVVTFSPDYLLRNPGEKARAWVDLVLAQGVVSQSAGATPGASA
jgi:uracil-DNA glycosylase family 4